MRIYKKMNKKFVDSNPFVVSHRNGIVALITVIVIALFLFSVGVLVGTQGNTSIFSGQFTGLTNKAEALARAGIEDATEKLARNSSTTGSYTLTETDGTISVTIAAGTPITVNVTGTVTSGKEIVQRAMQAQVTIDSDGKITDVTKVNQ